MKTYTVKRYDHNGCDLLEHPYGDYVRYEDYEHDQQHARLDALDDAALIADQVEAKADPGDPKETASEIGYRIRALMERMQ